MSLVASRIGLRHRVTIERLSAVSDGGGGLTEEWAEHLVGVPCRAWSEAYRSGDNEKVLGGKVAVVDDRRLVVPLGSDVTEADRISEVTDAVGAVVFPGPMRIESVFRHRTHVELVVSEVA